MQNPSKVPPLFVGEKGGGGGGMIQFWHVHVGPAQIDPKKPDKKKRRKKRKKEEKKQQKKRKKKSNYDVGM